MGSLQERIAACANLLAQLKELDQLRDRVKKAEKSCAATPKPSKRRRAKLSPVGTPRTH
jgi:hypothetical protein